jgi:DNA (cytosine-5)-methyltransferase 1
MLGGRVEQTIVDDFARLGYSMSVGVLSAADYHVPQVRQRVFFIGNRIGVANLHPAPVLRPSRYVTTRAAIADLMERAPDAAFNHVPTKHSADMARRLAAVPEGASLYANYSDAWKKCPWDAPSCTIKENHGGVNIHPRISRVLTAREMGRLQSFPDDFLFAGSKSQQLVQIGNAVPPLLGKAVGLALVEMAATRC